MRTIVSAEALHEAAHVVIAVRSGLTVTSAGRNARGLWYANINFDRFRDPPSRLWAYKIAGSVAVEIRNIALGRSDSPGFGKSGDRLSDCAFCERSAHRMRSLGMPVTRVNAYRTEIRANVERALRANWTAVEALACRLDRGIPVDGRAISKILQTAGLARHARAPEAGLWTDRRSSFDRPFVPPGPVQCAAPVVRRRLGGSATVSRSCAAPERLPNIGTDY
jgi:hypothetical protein